MAEVHRCQFCIPLEAASGKDYMLSLDFVIDNARAIYWPTANDRPDDTRTRHSRLLLKEFDDGGISEDLGSFVIILDALLVV